MVFKCNILVMSLFIMSAHALFKPHPVLKALEDFVEHIMDKNAKDTENPVLKALHEFVEDIIERRIGNLNITMATEMETMRQNIEDTNAKINRQIPVFHAMLSQDVMLNPKQTVIFDNVITNIGGAYNPLNGQFTAPKNGVYFFNASFLKRGAHNLHLQMMKNDTIVISRGHCGNIGAYSTTGTMTASVQLKAGDVVKAVGFHANEQIHGSWSFFTGHLISFNV